MTSQSTAAKRGRPRTGWTQIGVKITPDLLARVDQWRAVQSDIPARPEAIRRLVDTALAQTLHTAGGDAPLFGDRDRVRSDVYGTGTIVGPLKAMSSSPLFATAAGADRGWIASVRWDDAAWGVVDVAAGSLVSIDRTISGDRTD